MTEVLGEVVPPIGGTDWAEYANVRVVAGMLTPDLAAKLLATNDKNRTISLTAVNRFATDLRNGAWGLSQDAVVISETGRLRNAQHRCKLVCDTGIAIPAIFLIGTPDRDFDIYDQGRKRNLSDLLGIEGVSSANQVGAIIRRLKALSEGVTHKRGSVSDKSILDWYRDQPDERIGHIRVAVDALVKAESKVHLPTYTAVAYVRCREISSQQADEFFGHHIINGFDLKPGHPAVYVRERGAKLSSTDEAEFMVLLYKCWNMFRDGETTGRTIQLRDKRSGELYNVIPH